MSDQDQKDAKDAPPPESELENFQPPTNTSPYRARPREERLGILSEDTKYQ